MSQIIIKTGSEATDSDIAVEICDGQGEMESLLKKCAMQTQYLAKGVCCQTNPLDNSGNDFESGQTDSFKGQQLLGDCSKVSPIVDAFNN